MSFSYKTQKSVAPYRLWIAVGGGRYLMHGQRTHGHNHSVPVRSVQEARKVADAWREAGVLAPYLYPEMGAAHDPA